MQASSSAVLVVVAAAAAEDGSLQAATGAADFVFQKNPQNQKQKSTKSECKMGLFVLGCSKSLQLEEENAKDLVRSSEALESGRRSSSSSRDLCPCVD